MNVMWSEARARVSHRLATHLSAGPFRLLNEPPMVVDPHRHGQEIGCDQTQTYNEWLIFPTHDVAERPGAYGCSPRLMSHALEAASKPKIPVLNPAEALLCAGI